jgi:hypothetical protein
MNKALSRKKLLLLDPNPNKAAEAVYNTNISAFIKNDFGTIRQQEKTSAIRLGAAMFGSRKKFYEVFYEITWINFDTLYEIQPGSHEVDGKLSFKNTLTIVNNAVSDTKILKEKTWMDKIYMKEMDLARYPLAKSAWKHLYLTFGMIHKRPSN